MNTDATEGRRYSPQDIERIVRKRTKWRNRRRYHTPIGIAAVTNDYELVGVSGEVAFAHEFGMPIDEREHQQGDGGIDFTTPIGTVDVKTTRFSRNALRLKKGKRMADFIFMAQYDERDKAARLVGWIMKQEVEESPVEDAQGGDKRFAQNYVVSRRRLHSVEEFRDRLRDALMIEAVQKIGKLELEKAG